ncbi:MAG TPA: HEAT repeat domain-containing protein [Vicinamibacterales bacterium]
MLALGLCLTSNVALACPAPLLDIRQLVKSSDLVAVGRIESVSDAGPSESPTMSRRMYVGVLLADARLKGDTASDEIRFRFSQSTLPGDCSHSGVAAGTYRIVFLRGVDGTYEFTSGYYPSVVGAVATPPESLDPLTRVYHVLAAVLSEPRAPLNDRREAIYALRTSGNDETRAALHALARGGDPSLAPEATSALILLGDVTAMVRAEAILADPTPYPPVSVSNVRGAIGQIADPRAVPALARLMRMPAIETRRAAAHALRRSRSPAALQPLALALDDEDIEVQYSAVAGLSEITAQTSGMPSMASFMSNPEPHLARWREWARSVVRSP